MIGRRELLGIGSAALASCARSDSAYFGSTDAPKARRLVHTLAGEPDTLDPAKSTGGYEFYVIPALFEGLTQYHPRLPEPMAALATHYEASPAAGSVYFLPAGSSGSPRHTTSECRHSVRRVYSWTEVRSGRYPSTLERRNVHYRRRLCLFLATVSRSRNGCADGLSALLRQECRRRQHRQAQPS